MPQTHCNSGIYTDCDQIISFHNEVSRKFPRYRSRGETPFTQRQRNKTAPRTYGRGAINDR